jgi:hypothetical protein
LIKHDQFTNQQLTELRGQLIEEDGKVVGLQTEVRQGFAGVRQDVGNIRQDVGNIKQDVGNIHNKLDQQGVLLQQILNRLPPPQ